MNIYVHFSPYPALFSLRLIFFLSGFFFFSLMDMGFSSSAFNFCSSLGFSFSSMGTGFSSSAFNVFFFCLGFSFSSMGMGFSSFAFNVFLSGFFFFFDRYGFFILCC